MPEDLDAEELISANAFFKRVSTPPQSKATEFSPNKPTFSPIKAPKSNMFKLLSGGGEKKEKKHKPKPQPEGEPPTLREYLTHLFDANKLRSLEVDSLPQQYIYFMDNLI